MMSLQIASSSLASLIGMHAYEPTKVAMAKLWEKTDPRGLRARWRALHPPEAQRVALQEEARRAAHAAVRDAARSAAPVEEVHAAVGAAVAQVRRHVGEQTRKAQKEEDARLERALAAVPDGPAAAAGRAAARAHHTAARQESEKQAAAVLQREEDEIRRKAFTTRGIKDEDKALAHAAAEHGLDPAALAASGNAAFFRLPLNSENHAYTLVGYVDGLTDAYVVEVKNRMRRLFAQIPLYEKVQMHAYMALTDRPACLWVQRYKDSQESRMVHFDQEWWDTAVLPALHAAVDRFHAIMQDEKEQTLLLSAVEDAWRPRGAA